MTIKKHKYDTEIAEFGEAHAASVVCARVRFRAAVRSVVPRERGRLATEGRWRQGEKKTGEEAMVGGGGG